MPQIHFVSLFSVDLDYDIAPHWCEHYTGMGYDSYTVFLHTQEPKSYRYNAIKTNFALSGFTVIDAPDDPYTTQMRSDILDAFSKSIDSLDYMVVADSDEFHQNNIWIATFKDIVLSCDIVYGKLVDRWGDKLVAAKPDVSLTAQYPCSGNLFDQLLVESEDPDKDRWRIPNTNKILAARAGLPVVHAGSHVLYKQDPALVSRSGFIVDHYKWRHTIAQRLKTKWYYNPGYERAVTKHFNLEGAYTCESTC